MQFETETVDINIFSHLKMKDGLITLQKVSRNSFWQDPKQFKSMRCPSNISTGLLHNATFPLQRLLCNVFEKIVFRPKKEK